MIFKKDLGQSSYLFKVLLIVFLLGTSSSEAEQSPDNSSSRDWGLVGIEYGFADKSNATLTGDSNNSGYVLAIRGIFSRYYRAWAFEAGLGYHYDQMKKDDLELETIAAIAEMGGRYRFSSNWSIGPELHTLWGEDVSFVDAVNNPEKITYAIFGGFKIVYDFLPDDDDFRLRLGLKGLTDLSIENRQVSFFLLMAEVGLPFSAPPKSSALAQSSSQNISKTISKDPAISKGIENRLHINLKSVGVRFATGSSEPLPESKVILNKIASILKNYEDDWRTVLIEGHTDVVGDYDANIKLSLQRALVTKSIFTEKGLGAHRIFVSGLGSNRPLSTKKTPKTYEMNRRVELNIVGSKVSDEFVNELKGLGLQVEAK